MKLLIVTSSFPAGGRIAGLFVPELAAELNRLGCEIRILTQNCDSRLTVRSALGPAAEVVFYGWKGGAQPLEALMSKGVTGLPLVVNYLLRGVAEARRIAQEWRPDVIFAEWLVPAGLIARLVSRATGVPYAARALGSDVLKAARKPLLRPVVAWVARGAGALFADGFELCEQTSALAEGKRCVFAPTGRKLGQERSGYTPLDDTGMFTTCTVGRLHPAKGQDVLIEAVRALKDREVAVRSYLVGSGPEHDALAARIRRLGLQDRVLLAGQLPDGDVTDLLAHVDCVVIPSRSESIPLVLGEAAQAGKPVIATRVGDMGKLVEEYCLGAVVPPEDPVALAGAIEDLSRAADRSRFAARRPELLSLLSVENAARTIVRELQGLLDRRRAARA